VRPPGEKTGQGHEGLIESAALRVPEGDVQLAGNFEGEVALQAEHLVQLPLQDPAPELHLVRGANESRCHPQ
jgi:hypothetical protein